MKRLIRRLLSSQPSKKAQRFVDRRVESAVKHWIEEGGLSKGGATIPEIAEQIGVGAEQLSYYFRHNVGEPFLSWRKKERIKYAACLISEHPELSLNQLGYMVGIADKSNFRRQFREVSGISPSEYRKHVLAGKRPPCSFESK